MTSCQKKFLHGHAQMGESPELKTLFHRLCRLAAMPVCAVFVFDGPQRPVIKRKTRVVTKEHYLTEPFKELVEMLGFECWTVCRLHLYLSTRLTKPLRAGPRRSRSRACSNEYSRKNRRRPIG